MIFTETELKGAYIIEPERLEDERGFFAYSFRREDFTERGLDDAFVESYISFSKRKGTLRGMHYQKAPYAQAKLLRCTAGAVYDVGIDLRAGSPTFGRWTAVELSARNRRMIYLPPGFAHGFQTLEDETEVFYQSSAPYAPSAYAGLRWDDPAFGVEWPHADERIMNERDRSYPDFTL
jgi:dTDP-4-dehydrorhamnose 3,5-epimerase